MKKLLFWLLALTPIAVLAQDSWVRVVPEVATPVRMIATRDGGFVIWGWKSAGASKTNFFSKYNENGSLLWSKPTISRTGMGHTDISSVNEMSNGDVWLTGKATGSLPGKPSSTYTFSQRLASFSGDTVYTKYRAIPVNVQYLHSTISANRIFGISSAEIDPETCYDISCWELVELDEDLNIVAKKLLNGIAPYTSDSYKSTPSGDLFINANANNYHSSFSPPCVFKVEEDLGKSQMVIYNYWFNQYLSTGEMLINGPDGLFIYRSSPYIKTEIKQNYFPLEPKESKYIPVATSDNGFLIAGSYEESTTQRAFFLMKTDRAGTPHWKQYYPDLPGHVPYRSERNLYGYTEAPDGGVVFLITDHSETKLVKTNNKGELLRSTGDLTPSKPTILFFPNPTTENQVTLSFPDSFSGSIKLYDQTGRLLVTETLVRKVSHELHLPATIKPGMYYVRVEPIQGRVQTLKLVKN